MSLNHNQEKENSERTKSSNLISMVGDLDLADSHDQMFGSSHAVNGHHNSRVGSKVFEFVSRPHSLPRESVSLPEKEDLTMDMSLSVSVSCQQDARERIQEKINRLTPTPRSGSSSPKTLRNMREVKISKSKPIRPPSSGSPDLSLSHSGHAYNSAKYSDSAHNSIDATVNKSVVSLKSSDATLTGSVDTLVQTSICIPTDEVIQEPVNIRDSLSPPVTTNQVYAIVSPLKYLCGFQISSCFFM